MTAFEIPLSSTPQKFDIQLAGVTYQMTLRWNVPSQVWVLDIADNNSVRILDGIPLVTGANLLGQYDYLGFGGALYAQTDHDINATPTFDNLGETSHLYFITDD